MSMLRFNRERKKKKDVRRKREERTTSFFLKQSYGFQSPRVKWLDIICRLFETPTLKTKNEMSFGHFDSMGSMSM